MIKLEERGRGKFKPAPDYDINEIKNILMKKISEEIHAITDEPDSYKTNKNKLLKTRL